MNPTTQTLELRDIHLPTEISWWPLAPGWWIVIGLILLGIVISIFLYRRQQARKHYLAAEQELQKIKHSLLYQQILMLA